MSDRVHIINQCCICDTENVLLDASEDELEIGMTDTGKMVPVIPLIDDDWVRYEGNTYCPDCALEQVAAPEYFPDTHKEAAL